MSRATPPERPDGIARDAWLSEALRHAPDADATVPAAVRETILRQARAAIQPAMPAVQGSRWRVWLDGWLRPARLGYSGAFMVLLVVGVWGLDRLDEQAREPLAPPSPGTVAADAAPAGAASVSPPAAAVASPASVAPAAAVAVGPATALPPSPATAVADRAPSATRQVASHAAAEVQAMPERAAAPPAPMEPAPPLASPAPADAPATLVDRAARAQAEATPVAPAVASKALPPGAGSARLAAPPERASVAALDPLAAVLHRATEDASARWSVGPRNGIVDAAQRAWLDALRTSTAGQWSRANAAPIVPTVRLSSSAGTMASLGVDTAGTLWLVLGPTVYRAPLSADAQARFEEAASSW